MRHENFGAAPEQPLGITDHVRIVDDARFARDSIAYF